nr:hypothetical protein TetV2_00006 [Oceanusvirus sp.]
MEASTVEALGALVANGLAYRYLPSYGGVGIAFDSSACENMFPGLVDDIRNLAGVGGLARCDSGDMLSRADFSIWHSCCEEHGSAAATNLRLVLEALKRFGMLRLSPTI